MEKRACGKCGIISSGKEDGKEYQINKWKISNIKCIIEDTTRYCERYRYYIEDTIFKPIRHKEDIKYIKEREYKDYVYMGEKNDIYIYNKKGTKYHYFTRYTDKAVKEIKMGKNWELKEARGAVKGVNWWETTN